jgi:hypothetical protein
LVFSVKGASASRVRPRAGKAAKRKIVGAFRRFAADTRLMATRHRLSKHFVVEEFDCHSGERCGEREHNGLEYLCRKFLEPLRARFGPVHVNSGFRTVSYNRGVGGASNSFHIYTAHDGNDQASDVTCQRGTPKQWHAFLANIRATKRNGRGGLGLYPTFVHVDIRDEKADWRG